MIRLHIPGLPHTITNDEFSHCAFTGKILRFGPMMMSRGFEVYHYGVASSTIKVTKNIDLLSTEEWNKLRVESYKILHPELSYEEIESKLNDGSNFVGDLGNCGTPLYRNFVERFHEELKTNYRSCGTDLVCLPFGRAHDPELYGLPQSNVIYVESGIGYPDSYQTYRVFESYCKLHMAIMKEQKHCQHYWFVIPNYYDILEWPLNLNPDNKTIGYFGRITPIKGLNIIIEIAVRFRHINFVICGQGDPMPYLNSHSNIFYKAPIHGKDRGKYLNNLTALLAPSMYAEPFCGVNVEAQLCGTPVITNDFGAFVETIEPFKTGMLCHTLADFCKAVQMALDGNFDRQYIHDRAVKKYDMFNVAKQYEYAFKNILDIHNGNKGWYYDESHIDLLNE